MEAFVALVVLLIGAFIWLAVSQGISQVSNISPNAQKTLNISISKDTSLDSNDCTVYNINGIGSFPNKYGMELVGALYIYDVESNLPFLSNFSLTDESSSSRVFRRDVDFGYIDTGKYLPKLTPLTNVILEAIQQPYKGERSATFSMFYFDARRPVLFEGGAIVSGKENLIHSSQFIKTLTFTELGYMDEIENIEKSKPYMIEIAMGMAMSDGSLDKKEGEVIKQWMTKEIKSLPDYEKKQMKEKLNDALERSYKKLGSEVNVDQTISKFKEIASKNLKYEAIELCLEVLSADGVAEESELNMLRDLSTKLNLNFDEVQNLKDKIFMTSNIDITLPSGNQVASDESFVGMNPNLSKADALAIINKKYRTWNGRLNTLNAGNQRDHAQKMLDTLARLRKKYEAK